MQRYRSGSATPWATLLDTALPALTSGSGPQIAARPAEDIPVRASEGALELLDSWDDARDSAGG